MEGQDNQTDQLSYYPLLDGRKGLATLCKLHAHQAGGRVKKNRVVVVSLCVVSTTVALVHRSTNQKRYTSSSCSSGPINVCPNSRTLNPLALSHTTRVPRSLVQLIETCIYVVCPSLAANPRRSCPLFRPPPLASPSTTQHVYLQEGLVDGRHRAGLLHNTQELAFTTHGSLIQCKFAKADGLISRQPQDPNPTACRGHTLATGDITKLNGAGRR